MIKYTYADVENLIKTETQQTLEILFLRAKITYYEGNPFMDDPSFDLLQDHLKSIKSEVVKQVGSKRKDFDFSHPSPMLSLDKLQTELKDGIVNYQEEEFKKWYSKRLNIICEKLNCQFPQDKLPTLEGTFKFDGNAINLIYKGNTFFHAITRSDRLYGKDVTDRLSLLVPHKLNLNVSDKDIIEVRCEIILKKETFNEINKKRESEEKELLANPRNAVAGILGGDDFDEDIIKSLTIMPVHLLVNSIHDDVLKVMSEFNNNIWIQSVPIEDYVQFIKNCEEERKTMPYPLDGVVLAFRSEYRSILGENEHDPEWSIAIKFIPESVTTRVIDLEWNVGKTGELTPVIILEPVLLAGTIVKRVSGYNVGYVIQHKLGKGAIITIHKAGDIIPEIENVVQEGNIPIVPQACPICGTYTKFVEDIHLLCTNDNCPGKSKKRFLTSAKMLELKGVGPALLERFSVDFNNMIDLICWLKTKGQTKEIEKYEFEFGSRSYDKFINAFNQINELTYAQVILLLGIDNVGPKMAEQVANYHCELEHDFTGHDKSLIALLNGEDIKKNILDSINKLKCVDINIIYPTSFERIDNSDNYYIVMTGSPKPTWKTKDEFINAFNGKVIDVEKLSDKRCKYLITDSMNSTSSKMSDAHKKGINISTYTDFYNLLKK